MPCARHPAPPALPAHAIAFVAARHDRPERMALYSANGVLQGTFAEGQTMAHIAPLLNRDGLRVGAEIEGPAFPLTAVYNAGTAGCGSGARMGRQPT